VCNEEVYGFVMAPLEDGQTIDDDKRQLSNIKHEASGNQWICTVN